MRYVILTTLGCLLFALVHSQTNLHDTWMDPLSICTKEKITLDRFYSLNTQPPEDFESCIKPFENLSIIWLKFVASKESIIAFLLTPLDQDDDLDFALFESNNGIPGKLVRCVATGLLLDRDRNIQDNCKGPTGLLTQEMDNIELPGCSESQNNFVKYITVETPQEYLLLVTNFNSTGGFTLEWSDESSISNNLCPEQEEQTEFSDILIIPNPARRELTYNINSNRNREIELYLVSSSGNILRTEKLSISAGDNEYSMQLGNYSPGTYYLYVSAEQGINDCEKFELLK